MPNRTARNRGEEAGQLRDSFLQLSMALDESPGTAPIRNFNKVMVTCLATGGKAANPDFGRAAYFAAYFQAQQSLSAKPCTGLSFDSVFPDPD